MDNSVRNMKSWKEGTNVKWDVRVRHWIVLARYAVEWRALTTAVMDCRVS